MHRPPQDRPSRFRSGAAALVVPLALLLVLVAGMSAPVPAQDTAPAADDSPWTGTWAGAIEVPGSPLEVLVELTAGDDGELSGTIDIPAQGADDLPLAVRVEGEEITLVIENVPGEPTFTGTLSEDGTVLSGPFTQGGGELTFRLEREGRLGPDLPDPQEALEGYGDLARQALEDLYMVGASVAVVVGDEVVLVDGYGLRDRDAELPVTADTVFAIGSSTKAFTATLLATLVDEGAISWDTKVREVLPGFRLADEITAQRMTVRDLLTHTSGLPRHDLVWYGSELSRRELFDRLEHLEPTADLRERFQYQNLMYLTAGLVAEELTGESWEDLVRGRLFEPLAMDASVLGEFEGLDEVSEGYTLTPEREIDEVPYRVIEAIGPAGSINSTARDMAHWVAFQLGDGTVPELVGDGSEAGAGERVLSSLTLDTLHAPQVVADLPRLKLFFGDDVTPYMLYGHGWFVQPYRGTNLVHHGGNIDGFSAFVAFLPRERVGAVVLTNANGSPGPMALAMMALDRVAGLEPVDWVAKSKIYLDQMLEAVNEDGEEDGEGDGEAEGDDAPRQERVEDTRPSHPLADYAGAYDHPAYGAVVVALHGEGGANDGEEHLALERQGFDPIALEHWHYDVFNAPKSDLGPFKVQFHLALDGSIDRLAVPFEPALGEPIVFERRPPTLGPEELARFTGSYRRSTEGLLIHVHLRGEALVMTVQGQGEFTLVPAHGTTFDAEELAGYQVRFLEEDGETVALDLIQPNGTFRVERIDRGGEEETAEAEAAE